VIGHVTRALGALVVCAGVAAVLVRVLRLSTPFALLVSLGPPALLARHLLSSLDRTITSDASRRLWAAERERGARAGLDTDGDGKVDESEKTHESAEWANALIAGVWPVLNTDLLAGLTDMLEDIMHASAPSFVVHPSSLLLASTNLM
jgi:hypothetical protein